MGGAARMARARRSLSAAQSPTGRGARSIRWDGATTAAACLHEHLVHALEIAFVVQHISLESIYGQAEQNLSPMSTVPHYSAEILQSGRSLHQDASGVRTG